MERKLIRNGLIILMLALTSILVVPTISNNKKSVSTLERPTLGDTLNMSEGGDSSVSSSKDGISINKQVSWSTYDGFAKDSQGNPYVKVEFEVNETPLTSSEANKNDNTETVQEQKSADVVLVLDRSDSMSAGNKLSTMKNVAKDFVFDLLNKNKLDISNVDLRIGVVAFAQNSSIAHEFSTDKNSIKKLLIT